MRNQLFTRSLFVALCAFFVCASAVAENYLNPFAYRLDDMVEKSGGNLSSDRFVIKYRLSGPATSVVIRLWDATESTWTRDGGNTGTPLAEFDIKNLNDDNGISCKAKGEHTYTIDFTDVIGQNPSIHGKKVRWTIDVMGGNQSGEYYTENVTLTNVTKVTAKSNTRPSSPTAAELATELAKDVMTKENTKKTLKFIDARLVTEYIPFRYPGSVDICNDPYNYNFGAVFCLESYRPSDVSSDTYGGPSQGLSPGLYVFGGGMEHLKSRYKSDEFNINLYSGPGWNHVNGKFGDVSAVAPGRIRLSDENRIFISALSNAVDGENRILYEVIRPLTNEATTDNNFYECPWEGGSWSAVFTGGKWVTDGSSTSQYQTTGSSYMAAPNMGLDVRASGSSLQLLMLSAELGAIKQSTRERYHVDRYTLGEDETWSNKVPTSTGLPNDGKVNTRVHHDAVSSLVGRDATSIEYDPQGGYWIAQFRASPAGALAATMLHCTKTGVIDYEEHAMNRNKGAVRHNHNNTKLIVAGGIKIDTIMHKLNPSGSNLDEGYYNKATKDNTYTFAGLLSTAKASTTAQAAYDGSRFFANQSCKKNQFTIYTVSYASGDGSVTFTDSAYINTGTLVGVRDFAWDFANNLYVASYDGHRLCAFALPNAGKTASTPCKTKYNYTLSPVYNFEVEVLPASYATITHKRTGRAPYEYYLKNAKMDLRADVVSGCKFYQWSGNTSSATITGNELLIQSLSQETSLKAEIGLCVYENAKILEMQSETNFPAAFVQRELDDVSYSTICLPFDITDTKETPYKNATILKFTSSSINSDGDSRVLLTFEEVTSIEAGKPYLIKLNEGKSLQAEEIFTSVTCPVLSGTNDYGGLSVDCGNGITFHGIMNPSKIPVDENTLFLTADNRLVTLYGQNSVNINGLRGYFTVIGAAQNAEFVLNLPEKVTTSTPMVNIADSLQVTKYLWNGQIYIQRGNEVYDLSGVRVK